jgi:hypothetical protein
MLGGAPWSRCDRLGLVPLVHGSRIIKTNLSAARPHQTAFLIASADELLVPDHDTEKPRRKSGASFAVATRKPRETLPRWQTSWFTAAHQRAGLPAAPAHRPCTATPPRLTRLSGYIIRRRIGGAPSRAVRSERRSHACSRRLIAARTSISACR